MTMTDEVAGAEVADHAGVAFHPPLLLGAALALGSGARWLTTLSFLPDDLAVPSGPTVVAASFGWLIWAVVTMRHGGASIPTSEPTAAIVERGPYAWSRNPIYLSMVALQMGVGIWANSLWFLGLAIASAGLWWGVISREETYLEAKFGDAYIGYKGRVRRWI